MPFSPRSPIARTAALWLITLTILLFAAPFSSGELADFLRATVKRTSVPRSSAPRDASLVRAALMHVLITIPQTTLDKRQETSERLSTTLALGQGPAHLDARRNANDSEKPRPMTKAILRI